MNVPEDRGGQASKHVPKWIVRASLAFQAGCSCGKWQGTRQIMEADAKKEWREHVKEWREHVKQWRDRENAGKPFTRAIIITIPPCPVCGGKTATLVQGMATCACGYADASL